MLSNLSAFDLLTDAYLVLGADFRVIAANEQYCAFAAEKPGALTGRSIFEINLHGSEVAREQRERLLKGLFDRLKSEATAESAPIRYPLPNARDKDAAPYWRIFASKRHVTNKDGSAQTCYILRIQDVTQSHLETLEQRKQTAILRSTAQLRQRLVADAQLKSERDNEALREALAFARIGAWTLDMETGIIDCTAQCKANYGMPVDFLMTYQNLVNELIDPSDRQRVQTVLSEKLVRREPFEVEYRTIWPSGEIRWIMVLGKFPEGDDGTFSRLGGFSLDITDRKILELENAERMRVEVDARRASEHRVNTMDTFVSALSHELRSPLNAIASWAQLLDRPDQIALPRAADVIKRNVRQLSLMIEDLLDTGAVINQKFHVTLEPIDLAEIAKSVVEDARLNVEGKGLYLETDILSPCPILGDETRMRQVFFNLLTNAVKFTDKGGITVSLTVTEQRARFTVKDTGIGLSRDMRNKIFDRFNQVADIGAKRGGGLGLGLWIANTIVSAHHGTLTVESDGLGSGSIFVVELPRHPI